MTQTPVVAVIGGANLDIHGRPLRSLRRGDSNPGSVAIAAGGVARNVAENLARLKVAVQLFSVVGNDANGNLLLNYCRSAGVDVSGVRRSQRDSTPVYLSVLDASGDLDVGINDMKALAELTPANLAEDVTRLQDADILLADTNLSEPTLTWLAADVARGPLFVDAVSCAKARRIEGCLGQIHTLKLNRAEAATLGEGDSLADLGRLAARAHKRGLKRLFVTLGSDGVFYSTAAGDGVAKALCPVPATQNAGGAGDAFLAGLAFAWLHQWSLERTLRFAQAAAVLTLRSDGASSKDISIGAIETLLEKVHDHV